MGTTASVILLRLLLGVLATAIPSFCSAYQVSMTQDDLGGSIALCARVAPDSLSGVPPHAYVALSNKPANAPRKFVAIGFTSRPTIKPLVGYSGLFDIPESGMPEAVYQQIVHDCLELLVARKDYEAAKRSVDEALKLSPSPDPVRVGYGLTADQSVALIAAVAGKFTDRGIKVPERRQGERPLAWARRLIDTNRPRAN